MTQYEYKVVPAPTKGEKAKGVKQPDARFALGLENTLNAQAAEGWEFLRAEMLPNEERSGLSKTTKEWRNLLIFRRERMSVELGTPNEEPVAALAAPSVAPPTPQAPSPVAAREETVNADSAQVMPFKEDRKPAAPSMKAGDTPFEKLSAHEAAVPLRPVRPIQPVGDKPDQS